MDLQPDDPRLEFVREAESMARRSPEERQRWLTGLESRLKEHPQRERVLEAVRVMIGATKSRDDANLQLRHVEERLEADVVAKIEGLLDRSMELSADKNEAIRTILYISVVGHLMPHAKERLGKSDAQNLLNEWFGKYVAERPVE